MEYRRSRQYHAKDLETPGADEELRPYRGCAASREPRIDATRTSFRQVCRPGFQFSRLDIGPKTENSRPKEESVTVTVTLFYAMCAPMMVPLIVPLEVMKGTPL